MAPGEAFVAGPDVRPSAFNETRDDDSQARAQRRGRPAQGTFWLGRFRVERCLGEGSFGAVYLAHDDELDRPVAVKVPHFKGFTRLEDIEGLRYEARILARLDHEAIVRIYDVGHLDDGRCYIVSKYVDGTSLEHRLRSGRAGVETVAAWVARAAEALDYAHALGVFHRDVKPANLLINSADQLFVADFGLARRDGDVDTGRGFAGSPAYTSPEQARREGHRVDGRSDVFSLGVVLYEALSGVNPFRASSVVETLHNVANVPLRPLREIDPTIPAELDRICQKATAKRSDDRYESARLLAADLRLWLEQAGSFPAVAPRVDESALRLIVPRGLRPYVESDAGFFLELLPGPRGRDNLPDSVGFWKARIEPIDGVDPFTVGVIYGPTGCGKSSFVRAGLIPRLDGGRVRIVQVEATAEETEARLKRGLQRRFPNLSSLEELAPLLRELRQGKGLADGEKVLIVIDQFEQWLFSRQGEGRSALGDALRQCDGARVQALLLVRDEFWMDLTRFLRELEVRLVDGGNAAAIDLFDLAHARKVLVALGRAYNRLPARSDEFTADQRDFLDQALEGLAHDERVVCVRLVLFAELLRDKPWTPATLHELGGVEMIGVTFLDEAFNSPQAPAQNRLHRRAARGVLAKLLAEGGVAIKGHMVSREILLEASGYAPQPEQFEALMWVLDHQLRLVTPADPKGRDPGSSSTEAEPQYYQLTHDYLIPDLRGWLLRDQQQTMRGRAELRLQEFASVWSAGCQTKFLPTFWEWTILRLLTDPRRWSPTQQRMMRASAIRQARYAAAVAALAGLLGAIGFQKHGEFQAHSLVEKLKTAELGQVIRIANEIAPYRRWARPLLEKEVARGEERSATYCRIALLESDRGQVEPLVDRMVARETDPVASLTIAEALTPYRERISPGLWKVALDSGRPEESRFRAALALASYDPPSSSSGPEGPSAKWTKVAAVTADSLVTTLDKAPADYLPLVKAIGPIRAVLIPKLAQVFVRGEGGRRAVATNILVDVARDNPDVVGKLALEADAAQFSKLFPLLEQHQAQVIPMFRAEAACRHPYSSREDGERLNHRRAVAAIALLRLGQGGDAWEIFRNEPDPRARTTAIHEGALYGLPLETLVDQLRREDDVSRIRGLLLAIGSQGASTTPPAYQKGLRSLVRERFQLHPDAGVLGAAEWLLKQLGADATSATLDRGERPDRKTPPRNWYLTREGQRMVIIDARKVPGIERAFAIAAYETTLGQLRRFQPASWYNRDITLDMETSPAHALTWFTAINYCDWLDGQEKVPRGQACYPRDRPAGRMTAPDLARTGYRLSTQLEWEYACRAGTVTPRYYGDRDDLLARYAWFFDSSRDKLHPVGLLMPNDFGLFDMYGNVAEWNADIHRDGKQVIISGWGFRAHPERFNAATTSADPPDLIFDSFGFRIARTIELDQDGRPK